MSISFDKRVAIVTGAGSGLGRCHALALAARGAKVVVNDLADANGTTPHADAVVKEIEAAGGTAMSNGANVANPEQVQSMVGATMSAWGRVDILINNAGILRDKTFLKMTLDDIRQVIDVHLLGSMYCSKAVWEIMREQQYGRIVLTSSSTGLYGNFGQTNYGAAKMAMVGMMNTLHIEGKKYNIRVNCLAPTAGTAMTKGLMPDEVFQMLSAESVSPGVVFLCSEDGPGRTVLCAGGGSFAVYKGHETTGINLRPDELSAEGVAAHWSAITDMAGMTENQQGADQTMKFAMQAAQKLGIKPG